MQRNAPQCNVVHNLEITYRNVTQRNVNAFFVATNTLYTVKSFFTVLPRKVGKATQRNSSAVTPLRCFASVRKQIETIEFYFFLFSQQLWQPILHCIIEFSWQQRKCLRSVTSVALRTCGTVFALRNFYAMFNKLRCVTLRWVTCCWKSGLTSEWRCVRDTNCI